MFTLYQYNDNNIRIVINKSYYNHHKDKDKPKFVTIFDSDYSVRCALSRSKRMIREYSLCNDFKYFFTCTVNSKNCDRFSLSLTQQFMRKILKSIHRRNKDFKYLFITERHKDGAFHFHGLCTDLDLYSNNNGYYSSLDFDKMGFNSFSEIKDKDKVSNYITKYITKDCVKNEQGSVYFCSRGLKKATKYNILGFNTDDYIHKKPFENDYVKIYDLRLSELSKDELLYLQYNIEEI